MPDPTDLVRDGYNRLVDAYLAQRGEFDTTGWVERFSELVAPGGAILDLGCGAGVPVARTLSEKGFSVTGVDISENQIERARQLVPKAMFEVMDMAAADFPAKSFDGICALYSLIHVPRIHHLDILKSIRKWLKPNGLALLVLGAQDWENEEDYIDGVRMYWSHFGMEENHRLLDAAGLAILESGLVPDPPGEHWFVIAT